MRCEKMFAKNLSKSTCHWVMNTSRLGTHSEFVRDPVPNQPGTAKSRHMGILRGTAYVFGWRSYTQAGTAETCIFPSAIRGVRITKPIRDDLN